MRLINEYGFGDTRESVVLKAVILYDRLSELKKEGLVGVLQIKNENISEILTTLAIREASRLNDYTAEEIVQGLEDAPVTVQELKALLSRPLEAFLSFEVR